jgi:hypothetical protein
MFAQVTLIDRLAKAIIEEMLEPQLGREHSAENCIQQAAAALSPWRNRSVWIRLGMPGEEG